MIYYDNKKITAKEYPKPRVSKITIDTTGWIKDDPELIKNGTYPYMCSFEDSSEEKHRVATDGYKSGSFKEMLEDLQKRYSAVITWQTKVEVIVPYDILVELGYTTYKDDCGYIFCCEMRDLAEEGMDALDSFMGYCNQKPTKAMQRLQTCLDEALHQGEIGPGNLCYVICNKGRKSLFPVSISHYDKVKKGYNEGYFF